MLCIFWRVFKVLLEIWEVEGVQVLLGRKRREKSVGLELVKAVRGILMRECANLYKSMNIGTLVIFDMLCPNLPGAKPILSGAAILDNSKWLPPEI